jgi:hypothetical protein
MILLKVIELQQGMNNLSGDIICRPNVNSLLRGLIFIDNVNYSKSSYNASRHLKHAI